MYLQFSLLSHAQVRYGDGDEEELSSTELQLHLQPQQQQHQQQQHLGTTSTTYHCHRIIIGIGPRACSYFARLFSPSAQAFAEGGVNRSNLVFEESAAAAFPLLLDYVYSGELNATSETALALLEIAHYLGCRPAFDAAVGFINADLSAQTSPLYIREASVFPLAAPLLGKAIELCATQILVVLKCDNSAALFELPPELFVQVVQSASKRLNDTGDLSIAVADYLERNESLVNGQLLFDLSNSSVLSNIGPEAALRLLRLDCRYNSQQDESIAYDGTGRMAKKKKKELALKERCIQAIVSDFQGLKDIVEGTDAAGAPFACLEGLPKEVEIMLLRAVALESLKKEEELKGMFDAEVAAHQETVDEYNYEALFRDNMGE
jgi:hypothetical protein